MSIKIMLEKYFDNLQDFNNYISQPVDKGDYLNIELGNLISEMMQSNDTTLISDILANPSIRITRIFDQFDKLEDEDDNINKLVKIVIQNHLTKKLVLTDPYLINELAYYYEQTEDPEAITVIMDLINNHIKDDFPFAPLPRLGYYPKTYAIVKKRMAAAGVLNTALGLRQTGFPPHVVENIASYANDTTGFTLYELMNMITPVMEHAPGTAPEYVEVDVPVTRKKRRVRKQ